MKDTWGAELVLDVIEEDEYDGRGRKNGRRIIGHAFVAGVVDEHGRKLLAVGSDPVGRRGRKFYLLGDDHPEDPRVRYLEAPSVQELARKVMANFDLVGTIKICWENWTEDTASGVSETLTV